MCVYVCVERECVGCVLCVCVCVCERERERVCVCATSVLVDCCYQAVSLNYACWRRRRRQCGGAIEPGW